MKLYDRLKKIEAKAPAEKKIMVVKFGNELTELSCGGETFCRDENEPEGAFIMRIRSVVQQRTDRPLVTVLVGNF